MMYDSGVKSLVIGRGQCRWKNIKCGYPYLISTEKFIHWMPADDLRIGSYTPGDQVSKGLFVHMQCINPGASCLQHFPKVLQLMSSLGPSKTNKAANWRTGGLRSLACWGCHRPAAQPAAEALTLLTVCTSPTSPHYCAGGEFWREDWGSINRLPWNTNGSVQLYPSGPAFTKC